MIVQVAGKVDITTILDSQMVAKELERNDVKETLKSIHGLGNADSGRVRGDALITVITKNDRPSLTSSDLSECRLNLGVQGILCHDDNDRHVLINERKRTMFEFASKNTLRVHITDFLNLEGTFQARRMPRKDWNNTWLRKNVELTDILDP